MRPIDASFRPHPQLLLIGHGTAFTYSISRMNNADIAWMLVSTALVLLMTPALAFFYGGLVRSKNALNTMMMSFVALGPVAVVWALLGYSLAFAPGNAFIGSLSFAGLRGVGMEAQGTIPHLLFMAFQGTFAIITPGADFRARWSSACASTPTSPSSCCGWSRCMRRSRTGSGAAASWRRWARSISPAARWCTSTPRRRRWSRRWSSVRARITAVTPSFRTTCPSRCSAPACCGSAGSASTPAARYRPAPPPPSPSPTRCSRPPPTLAAWTLIDMLRGGTVTAVGAATAIVVGLVVDHAGGRLCRPDRPRSPWARSARFRVTSR